ncbi:hypothetical protein V1524DRAFT_411391 [Lipomyces starkeyi]
MANMKLLSLAMLVAFTAGALAIPSDIYLEVKSENSTIDGMGITSIREGDALNYVFLAAVSQLLVALVISIGENPARFRINPNGYLTYNGSVSVFYAAKNTSDPYYYSLYSYQALYFTDSKLAPIGSIPFTVYADFAVSPNISTTSSTASTTSMTTSMTPTTAASPYTNTTSTGNNISATAPPPPPPSAGAAAMNEVYSSLAIATTFVLAMLL